MATEVDPNIVYHYESPTYDVYFSSYCPYNVHCCLLRGAENIDIGQLRIGGVFGMYLKLAEGETFEFHLVDPGVTDDYTKAVYTASGGTITATSEHNVVASLYPV